jgi:3-methyladenine DNA glycosylase AlkD
MDRRQILAWLENKGSRRNVAGMARYGIVARHVFGVSMGTLLTLKKRVGTDHALSLALWDSGWYEARLLAALIGDPARVTRRQMNAWAAAFENWADCDTVCFHLFDRTPFAWQKARQWAASPREFVKRAAFALMASLALHDKAAPDRSFRAFLPIIEKGAHDERNFVKKGVSWALRSIGRRNAALNTAARAAATRMARSPDAAARWVGKDALRDLASPKVRARLARRAR